jgi:EmrB/QacA subfamily drug resistance transporter
MCLAVLIAQIDTSVANLVTRPIAAQFHAGVSTLQWVVDAYNLAYACLLLTGGTLGDLYGRRRVFRLGLAAFTAGSLVCGLAPGITLLIAGRALTGLGAALALPSSLAILTVSFPGARQRAHAIGIWAGCNGIGLAISPTLGGVLVAHAGWRSVFLLIVPIALAGWWLAHRRVPESADPHGRRLDPAGQVFAIVALAAPVLAVIEAPRLGWTAWPVLAAIATGATALAAFLAVQRGRDDGMVPLALFRNRAFSAAMAVAALMTFGIYGMLFLLPIYLQAVRGTALDLVGLELLPMALAFVLVSRHSGPVAAGCGARSVLAAGMTLVGSGLLLLGLVETASPLWYVELAALAIGAGLGLCGGPVMAVAVANAPRRRAGTASGLGNTARMLGATLGVAVLGRSMRRWPARASPPASLTPRWCWPACRRRSAAAPAVLSPARWWRGPASAAARSNRCRLDRTACKGGEECSSCYSKSSRGRSVGTTTCAMPGCCVRNWCRSTGSSTIAGSAAGGTTGGCCRCRSGATRKPWYAGGPTAATTRSRPRDAPRCSPTTICGSARWCAMAAPLRRRAASTRPWPARPGRFPSSSHRCGRCHQTPPGCWTGICSTASPIRRPGCCCCPGATRRR